MPVIVAAIGDGLDGVSTESFFGLLSHAGELVTVIHSIGDFVSDDEVVLGLDSALHVIANGSCCFACPLHSARIGIGERNLCVFRLCKLRSDRFHALDFLFQPASFIFEAGGLDFWRGWLTVSGFKLGQIPLDARLDLFQPLGHLGRGEVPVA